MVLVTLLGKEILQCRVKVLEFTETNDVMVRYGDEDEQDALCYVYDPRDNKLILSPLSLASAKLIGVREYEPTLDKKDLFESIGKYIEEMATVYSDKQEKEIPDLIEEAGVSNDNFIKLMSERLEFIDELRSLLQKELPRNVDGGKSRDNN